jgi:hypothetical protein
MENLEGNNPYGWRASQSLDDRYYNLDEEETTFYKQETGIENDGELKQHIIDTQAKAYAVRHHAFMTLYDVLT